MTADNHEEITREEWESWYTPLVSTQLLRQSDGPLSRVALLRFMKAGRIRVVAEQMIVRRARDERTIEFRTLPREWFDERTGGDLFWSHGIFEFEQAGFASTDPVTVHACTGVRLDPAGVRHLLPQELPAQKAEGLVNLDSLPAKRGRPAAEFWEDLIIEIARRMYEAEFKPSNQAEVAEAMAQWIEDNGYTGGETQIKERARKVYRAFKV